MFLSRTTRSENSEDEDIPIKDADDIETGVFFTDFVGNFHLEKQ